MELANEVASIYPSVVSSYDAQGNAIVNLGDNAEAAANKLSGLLDQQRAIANYQIAENAQAEFVGAKTRAGIATGELETYEADYNKYKGLQESLTSTVSIADQIMEVYNDENKAFKEFKITIPYD